MHKQKPVKIRWNKELVENFWNVLEQTRLKELSFSHLAGSMLLDFIEPELSTEKEYLDFGSGSGDMALCMLKKGYKVAVYDVADNRLESLKQTLNNYDYFLGVMTKGSTKLFDTILMIDVIEHILPEELDETLFFIKSKLKPGGTLIISTPNNEDVELGECYCPMCNHMFHRWQHQQSFTVEKLEKIINKYLFITKNVHLVDFSMGGILIEENKQLKKQIDDLKNKNLNMTNNNSHGFNNNVINNEVKNIRMGAQNHIIYIARSEDDID